jgi:hypothetical protein
MRALAALLLLTNLLFLALAQGWLLPLAGLSTHQEREPQRLVAQVHPEIVRIVAAGAAASAPEGTQCLQAGPFGAEQADAALATLADKVPAGSVRRVPAQSGGEAGAIAAQFWLRAEAADAASSSKLQALTLPGGSFGPCRP